MTIQIGNNKIGKGNPVYIIAEISANHNQDFSEAEKLIYAAKDAGANAIKIQTYTPDTLTLDCKNKYFRIGKGTQWEGKTLYKLYGEACTPWDWQPNLQKIAAKAGLDLFSSPFDPTSVEFLHKMNIPAYKIASFEIVDIPLIRQVARIGKPVIISTGMASLAEIRDAVDAARREGNEKIALLKCTSAYPALPEEMNLCTIPHLIETFHVPVGLSDHSLGITAPVVAVTLGASIIEKHITMSRSIPGPDSAFSLEPHEFSAMVNAVRQTEKSIGAARYDVSDREKPSLVFRRSLFVVKDMKKGDTFTTENIRSIRPGYGIPPNNIDLILGRKATKNIIRGTPLSWEIIE